jgi:2'-5' RNA ligase
MPADSLRLFFALGCPPELAAAIAAWRDPLQLPGRPVAEANLHLTLAFIGQQPLPRVAVLQELAAQLHAPAFELQLDQLNHFRNGLLYLAPSQPPEALLKLAEQLREALLEAGISLQSRPYHPHLSLMRHCPIQQLDTSPTFDWSVRHFALFASESAANGRLYRQLQRWSLG